MYRARQQPRIEQPNRQLWKLLFESHGDDVPLLEDRGPRFPWRLPDHAGQAKFPREYF